MKILSLGAMCLALVSHADGEIYHQNNAARAVQQHMVAIKEAVNGIIYTIEQHYNGTGDWPSALAVVNSSSSAFNNLPIEASNDANGIVSIRFTDKSSINIPAALTNKMLILTPEKSDTTNTTVERWTCKTNIDKDANLWDGYMAPMNGNLSRLAFGLGEFYKDCKYDSSL